MNRTEKSELAAKLRAKLADIRAAPDDCARRGEDYAAKEGGPGSATPFAFGALQCRVAYLAAELEALIVTTLDRGRGRK